ncbi:MAG: dihydroorotase, partial [Actinobacteria bacterium]|nr:dihydroorotase [Actinomycetota bacterium]
MIVIRGGRVLTGEGLRLLDVVVEGEVVVAFDSARHSPAAAVIDATGCLVGPGFVDLHTHLRDPGQTWKEDLESGSRAAAAGGFTAVTAMPNTDPPLDDPKLVADVADRGAEIGLVDVGVAAAVTRGRAGRELAPLEELHEAGARIFTDDGDAVDSPDLVSGALERLRRLPGAVLAQHAEDFRLSRSGGSPPAEAEVEMVRRDLRLVAETGGRYHCQHVSTAATVELIGDARDDGLEVTAEVTPHHLSFDREAAETGDPNFKMYPPLRSASDREALVQGLAGGVIDAVATDHAPHTQEEKQVAWEAAPRGVVGLETAASAVWEALGDPGRLFEVLAAAPARIAALSDQGLPVSVGGTANL